MVVGVTTMVSSFRDTLDIKPDHDKANFNLGMILADKGRYAEAVPYLRRALQSRQKDVELLTRVAGVHFAGGDIEGAIETYRKSIEMAPKDPQPAKMLAWVLATAAEARWRNGEEAVRLAQRARELEDRPRASTLNVLAAAYAETGRYQEAVTVAQEALSLLRNPSSDRAVAMRRRLELYQAEEPFRQRHGEPVNP